jgi:hypothetical protein
MGSTAKRGESAHLPLEGELSFVPSSTSMSLSLDHETRLALSASLQRLQARASAMLPAEIDISEACRHLQHSRACPGAVAAYYELVAALQAGRRADAAACWRRIAARPVIPDELLALPFTPEVLGEDAARFQRLLSVGWRAPQIFAVPGPAEIDCFKATVPAALQLLSAVAPAWRAELESLLGRIYGAMPTGAAGQGFAGASSRLVWGAVFVNIARNNARVPMLVTLCHEASHQLLFGLSLHAPLTLNPPEQRFVSPLRNDPRPMDGVYHATFVAARLSLLYALLRDHAGLTPPERALAASRVPDMRRRFEQGRAVVDAQGELSPLGRQLLDAASAKVAALFA